MKWFINYRQDSISPSDRGLAYGDGLFETIHANTSGFQRLDLHLSRLCHGLSRLAMPFSEQDVQTLRHFLDQTILPLIDHDSVVKIIVTRGQGGRGYLPPERVTHTICVGLSEAPDYSALQRKGVSVSISTIPTAINPYLAGLKHLNRLENVLAKQALAEGEFESVMLNAFGEVIECIQSNIFWFQEGVLRTPLLSVSGVKGTYRHFILAEQSTFQVEVGHYRLEDLKKADEIFITNSLMGIVPVTSLAGRSLPVGVHTQKLQSTMQTKDAHAGF